MKSKLLALLKKYLKKFWALLSHNLGYKLLSVCIAVFLWSYVVYSNPNITRSKMVSGVDITVSGETVLDSRGFALLTDVGGELTAARVQVQVSQSSFPLVTADNVRVELDLSSLRDTGKQSVKLIGTSTYGRVTEIWPEYVEVEVEKKDQRYVPVNPRMVGEKLAGYWYDFNRVNPSQIVVSGPASIVQKVSSARVDVDVTGRTASHDKIAAVKLLDEQDNELDAQLQQATSSSSATVTVGIDIYPTKTLPISTEVSELLDGQPRRGYAVTGVEVNPQTVVVAAEQSLLDSLETLVIEPVSVSGADRSFSATARISTLKGIKNLSSNEVGVKVSIEEQTLTRKFSNVQAALKGTPDAVNVKWQSPNLVVSVSGPYSSVLTLSRADLSVSVDLTGLQSGAYDLPVAAVVESHPEMELVVEPATVKVVIEEKTSGTEGT